MARSAILALLLGALVLLPGTGQAQLRPGAVARATAIDPRILLEQARKAAGGEAWARVRGLRIHSMLVAGGQQGESDTFQDTATGRYLQQVHLGSNDTAEGFDGVSVWTRPTGIEAYVYGDADATRGAINESFRVERGWWFPERHAATSQYMGEKAADGRVFDIVQITPEGGRPFALWIDRKTHLIDRDLEQQAEQVQVIRYSDYRWVDGIRLPWTTTRGGDTTTDQQETVQSVEANPALADTLFALPAATPAAGPESVTVPFRLENNQILIDVSINGAGPFEADFDSGGSLIIPPTIVTQLALPVAGAEKITGGGEGSVVSGSSRVQSLGIGGAMVKAPRFIVLQVDDAQPRRLLVGQEILSHYVVRIDFDRMTMTLTRPDAFEYRGHGAIVPFHFQDNQPEVLGAVDGIAGVFTVDTGADGSLLLIAPFARRYGLAARYRAVIPYGGTALTATHGVYARAGEVTLSGADGRPVVRVTRPVTRISLQEGGYDANRYVSGNIEVGILKQFNVTFDYARQRLIFEPNLGYGKVDVFSVSGLHLHAEDDGWTVTDVYAGSAADAAGIRKGDKVVRVNGKARAQLDRGAMHQILTGPEGTVVSLTLRTAAADREVSFALRDAL